MEVPQKYIRTKADRDAIEAGCYWDQEQADKIIRFAETYTRPQFIEGDDFTLLDWQKEWLAQLYGWRLPDGRRRWRKALLTVGKKNGKTLLTSIICLYEAIATGTPNPICVSASTTRENSKQIFDQIKNTIVGNDRLKRIAKVRSSQRVIRFENKGAEFRSISNDAGNAEGLNISCCVCDEVHAWGKDALWRTLEYSNIARPDGILIVISTAGKDQSHFFYSLVSKAKNIIQGTDTDQSFFATVYETPEGEEETPEGWRKSNPSLGTSFTEADFLRDLTAAKSSVADWLSFCRFRLNQWRQAEDSWLNLDHWDQCKRTIQESELTQCPAWIGVDLSQSYDPTSISIVWHLGQRKYYVRTHAFVAMDGVVKREATNLPNYRTWAASGHMTITQGDMIDEGKVKGFIKELTRKYQVKEVIFDPYSAFVMANDISNEGMIVYRHPQNHKHMTGPCKEFEKALGEGRICHDGANDMARWAVQNVRLDVDSYGNCKPSRAKSVDKIDPVVSMLMAFSRALESSVTPVIRPSVYENKSIFAV